MVQKSILVAEDDDDVREALIESLDLDGWKIVEAVDGKQAVQKFTESPTDILLTDLMMPGLDGMTVLAEMNFMAQDVPVIVITGFASIDRCRDALKAGANDFIQKPVSEQELLKTVNKALATRIKKSSVDQIQSKCEDVLEISVPAVASQKEAVLARFAASAEAAGFGRKKKIMLLALDEAFTNAVIHGAKGQVDAMIEIRAKFKAESAFIRVADSGQGFDRTSVPAVSVDNAGGRGVFLMDSFCDEVRWLGNGNICEMVFQRLKPNSVRKRLETSPN